MICLKAKINKKHKNNSNNFPRRITLRVFLSVLKQVRILARLLRN
jgi:hypothetical protein